MESSIYMIELHLKYWGIETKRLRASCLGICCLKHLFLFVSLQFSFQILLGLFYIFYLCFYMMNILFLFSVILSLKIYFKFFINLLHVPLYFWYHWKLFCKVFLSTKYFHEKVWRTHFFRLVLFVVSFFVWLSFYTFVYNLFCNYWRFNHSFFDYKSERYCLFQIISSKSFFFLKLFSKSLSV